MGRRGGQAAFPLSAKAEEYRSMRRWIAIVLLTLAASTATAGFDDAIAAYKQGDFAVAVREFRAAAKRGGTVRLLNKATSMPNTI
jgi:hypothetical protein